jgi:putative ABC transport system permease protein
MQFEDLWEETFLALTGNKMRSGLTMLGIVIGIASVVSMISIGEGSQSTIAASINSIGANLVLVEPGAPRGVGTQVSAGRGTATTLTSDDATVLQQLPSVVAVAPESDKRYQVLAKGTNTNTSVTGTVAEYPQVRNIEVGDGSFFTDNQVTELAHVAVIGPTTATDLFATDEPVGQTIRINNIDFTVIGVTQSKGGTSAGNSDDVIYVPISVLQKFLQGSNSVSVISVEAQTQGDMATVEQEVTNALLARHDISNAANADFQVLDQQDIVATASSVTNTFTALLASIAGISLVVGGIGIMNMMLTTVTERTREIGLRKAIGANRTDINMQFLAESFALTVIGGIIGISLGWLISVLIAHFAGIPTKISWLSIILAFGVSAIIGVVFGYYPARRASALNPIEALRYE